MLTGKEIKKYIVWVDGERMSPKMLTYTDAKALLLKYQQDGYYDVIITGAR
jgi:hypothetical protein